MKYLLDTQIILWALINDSRLPKEVINIINDSNNDIYFSTISPWEVEIKHQNKDSFKLNGKQLTFLCEQNGLLNIPVKNKHIKELENLNKNKKAKHCDLFDRMLLCQAISENMMFITHDHKFEAYNCKNLLII